MPGSANSSDSVAPPAVVSIGVFDGVHLGHQAILKRNCELAHELGAQATVVTFRRHPKKLLLGREPRTLTSLEHRLALFARADIQHALALAFDENLRNLSAERFVREILIERLGAVAFVLGFDSKFGRGREGSVEMLRSMGERVEVAAKIEVGSRAVSSTAIREAVELGDLISAERMLGRPVSVMGNVVHGQKIGETLGFPTANLNLHHQLHPPLGVYACRVRRLDRSDFKELTPALPAVTNIGIRPTLFGEASSEPLLETHLLAPCEDLYGSVLEVEFAQRLRNEMRFDGLPALREQIKRDVEAARKVLGNWEPLYG